MLGILSVLITTIIYTVNPFEQFKKAQDSKRKSDLAQIQRGLEAYYQDHGKYPDSSSNKIYSQDSGGNFAVVNWGSSWSPYMSVLPSDPNVSKKYVYYSSGGQSYYIFASLDRAAKDPQVCNPDGNKNTDDKCTNAPVSCGTSGQVCDYGVSSPNVSP